MGRPKMDSGINAIEEEPEEFDSTSNTGALACMINFEVGAVLAIMRRNVRSDETGAPIIGVILPLVYKILTLNVIDLNTVNVEETIHLVVDVVTSYRFEVTDPASEEVVLIKILQVLLACMKSKAAIVLSNQHVCTIVNTCFRVVHQAGTKDIVEREVPLANGVASSSKPEVRDYSFGSTQLDNAHDKAVWSTLHGGNISLLVLSFKHCRAHWHGASYQQQEVAMEALVDFCRQKTFMVEMYANLDCDITCNNVFEDLSNLLSKSVYPVNCPLSTMHIPALDGLITVIQGMAERIGNRRKYIKRRLMIGADHFNRDPKKGLEFLQGTHLLPDKLDPQSVACFFRYTAGLDKNLVGDFFGNHDDFCVQVLHEFAWTFDFEEMNLDTALRLFLETFQLPGVTKNTKGARDFL
ncbi:hypothetical protein GIB67_010984 [Kingdonia uniflora]|uniref:SEC7 domain-containing protein n=1 Tax=Kingdonia uniflora TaxID=39325 RepID=A0A7J7MMN9_9MAGN|nr:hypothetical protein GIB67_010984 [Kingdonia uniflora]